MPSALPLTLVVRPLTYLALRQPRAFVPLTRVALPEPSIMPHMGAIDPRETRTV